MRSVRLLAAALMAVALAGSSGTGAMGVAVPIRDGREALATEARPLVVLITAGNGPFATAMACGARQEAEGQGAELLIAGGGWDPERQVRITYDAIAAGADALILQPALARRLAPVTQAALDAGVAVVLVDTDVRPALAVASRVATDNARVGREAARLLVGAMTRSGTVLVFTRRGVTSTADRVRGFREDLVAGDPALRIEEIPTPRGEGRALDQVNAALQAWPDAAGVFAASGELVRPAAMALEMAGLADVPVVGLDAGPSQARALRAGGSVRALIAQDPVGMGRTALRQALHALDGQPSVGDVVTDTAILTPANVDDPAMAGSLYPTSC